uniref:Uncharacterized protein n=1 Tax=Acrobeloides nanus TaxID=290746 RepID=A0A914E4E5_9BILA
MKWPNSYLWFRLNVETEDKSIRSKLHKIRVVDGIPHKALVQHIASFYSIDLNKYSYRIYWLNNDGSELSVLNLNDVIDQLKPGSLIGITIANSDEEAFSFGSSQFTLMNDFNEPEELTMSVKFVEQMESDLKKLEQLASTDAYARIKFSCPTKTSLY